MKVEVMSRKLIKPSTPTPSSLRKLKLSYLDELAHAANFSVLLYYPSSSAMNNEGLFEELVSQVLDQFYPLAGRYIKEEHVIDCSDQGVEYVQALVVDCDLFDHIDRCDYGVRDLVPLDDFAVDQVTHPLLGIQVSKFRCGGLAICFSVSHRVFDAASLDIFIAALTTTSAHKRICPVFVSNSIFPTGIRTSPDCSEKKLGEEESVDNKVMTTKFVVGKRFVFDTKAISNLRAKALMSSSELESSGCRKLSRVRLVTALIAKAFAKIDKKRFGKSRALLVSHLVNFRERTNPPLPKYSCGNFWLLSPAEFTAEQCQIMEFQDFVHFVGDSIANTLADCAQIMCNDPVENVRSLFDAAFGTVARSHMNNANSLWFSDWSKYRFYEADFGWGTPIWVRIPNTFRNNTFLFINTKSGDGIEAWVRLDEQDMALFEEDEEIKMFATTN